MRCLPPIWHTSILLVFASVVIISCKKDSDSNPVSVDYIIPPEVESTYRYTHTVVDHRTQTVASDLEKVWEIHQLSNSQFVILKGEEVKDTLKPQDARFVQISDNLIVIREYPRFSTTSSLPFDVSENHFYVEAPEPTDWPKEYEGIYIGTYSKLDPAYPNDSVNYQCTVKVECNRSVFPSYVTLSSNCINFREAIKNSEQTSFRYFNFRNDSLLMYICHYCDFPPYYSDDWFTRFEGVWAQNTSSNRSM